MKPVIQIVQHLSPGGIEAMVLDLAAFSPPEVQTYIISLEGTSSVGLEIWPRLRSYAEDIFFLGKKPGIDLSLILKIREIIKYLNADVIHTHHIGPLLYGSLAAWNSGVSTHIHTEHDAWHLASLRHRILQRNIIRFSRPLLVADAVTVKKVMSNRLSTKNIRVIYNGIDTKKFTPGNQNEARSKFGLPKYINLIGCSGRLEAVKGQDRLIKALQYLPKNTHLALAGSGSCAASLLQLSITLDVHNRVHFLGNVDDMPMFYRALDVFCLSSLREGFPLAPLEAQACGIKTAVTDVGGAHETLSPINSKLITEQDPKSIAMALLDMKEVTNPASPREYIENNFDVRKMVKDYHKLHFSHEA